MNKLKCIWLIPLFEGSCFHPLTNSATGTILERSTQARRQGFPMGTGGELLCQSRASLKLPAVAEVLSEGTASFYTLASCVREFPFPQLSDCKIVVNMIGVKWCMIVISICISLLEHNLPLCHISNMLLHLTEENIFVI